MCVSFVLTIVFGETFVGSTADIMYIRFFSENKYEVVNIPVHDNANKTHNSVSDNLCKQSWVMQGSVQLKSILPPYSNKKACRGLKESFTQWVTSFKKIK